MNRIIWMFGVLGVLGAGGAAFYYGYWLPHRDEFPSLAITDLDARGFAAKLERANGPAFKRIGESGQWQEIGTGDGLVLGTMIRLDRGSSVTYQTAGNWIVVMDGPGEFLFEDAKRTTDSGVRSVQFQVKQGLLRLKPHTGDLETVHWAQVTITKARIVVEQGEIGVEVSSAGDAKTWLMDGKGIIFKPDGSRERMGLKGLIFL